MPGSILLIDDDPHLLRLHARFFGRSGWEVYEAASAEEGLELHSEHTPDLVLLDLHLPGMSGLEALRRLVAREAAVILLTGNGGVQSAVEAMQMGADNFLVKPVDLQHLEVLVERTLEKVALRRTNRLLAAGIAEEHRTPDLGCSPRMREIGKQVELLAASDSATVLLLGESGTGKSWVAQMLHAQSPRARGPIVELNCAGLSPTLLDSELFGHEKGAFTDAKSTKRGLFEIADGGTLFLDEIGDLAPELQPKLLKVLERKAFRRVGGTREIQVDVRLIAATNRNLEQAVQQGRFREDLFYRLNVLPLTLPALRERRAEDVADLIQRFLQQFAPKYPRSPTRLSHKTLRLLLRYEWPGNIRELKNALERALVLSTGAEEILPLHLPPEIRACSDEPLEDAAPQMLLTLEEVEQRHIERVLRLLNGNRTRSAEALGISRATLQSKIKRFALSRSGVAA